MSECLGKIRQGMERREAEKVCLLHFDAGVRVKEQGTMGIF